MSVPVRIERLIKELEKIKEEHGNLDVYLINYKKVDNTVYTTVRLGLDTVEIDKTGNDKAILLKPEFFNFMNY